MFWRGQHARFVFAENAITIARHDFVDRISKRSRQRASNARHAPDAAELLQHVQNCI